MTDAQIVAVDTDIVTMALVFCGLAFGLVLAIWGIFRSTASKADVAALATRVQAVERKTDESCTRMVEMEKQISHLPTSAHVHSIDIRLERVAATVEASARQIDRMHDHMLATSAPAPKEPIGDPA